MPYLYLICSVVFVVAAKYIFSEILGIHRIKAGGNEFTIETRSLRANGTRKGSLMIPNYGKITVEVIESNGELLVKSHIDGDILLRS